MPIGSNDNSYLTHLECSACKTLHDHGRAQSVCGACGQPLLARYDLGYLREKLSRDDLNGREASMWRYREVLPVLRRENIVSLKEGFTPVMRMERLAKETGLRHLMVKEEAVNPTGSFKARGLSMAVTKAKELGFRELCIPTAGNAGAALAAYAAKAGMRAYVFMPEDTPSANIHECRLLGADVHLVRGLISDAAVEMNKQKKNWLDVSTLKEPYRLEGKKTMGYELAEQLQWELPEVIVYPTGGGTGLIGMWKAFEELEALGWISSKRPRMVAVQSRTCAPVIKAFEAKTETCAFWENAATIASGLRVPKPFADRLILRALYESGGMAIAVADDEILEAMRKTALCEGMLFSPEGAACVAALPSLMQRRVVLPSSTVLVFNTGSVYKYTEALSLATKPPSGQPF